MKLFHTGKVAEVLLIIFQKVPKILGSLESKGFINSESRRAFDGK